jgi:hypothetical protein
MGRGRTTWALVLLGLAACASDPVRPPNEGDRKSGPTGTGGGSGGGTKDGGTTPDTDSGLGTCTDLTNKGAVVDENAIAGDFVGTGGAILDGTYDVIEARLYLGAGSTAVPGPTNRSYKGTIRVEGTTYESVLVTQTGGVDAPEVRTKGTLTADGTSAATLALSCPSASQERLNYSVSGTGLTLSNAASRVTFVYAREP